MRFVILAAVAALGMSGPASAATWVWDVSGDFSYQLTEYLNLGGPIPQVTVTSGVERASYRITTYFPATFGIAVTEDVPLVGKFPQQARNQGFYTPWTVQNGSVLFGPATFTADNYAGSPCNVQEVGCYLYFLQARAENVTANFVESFDGPGPVPEPSTWAMMIGGFGMVGGSIRYRRRKMTVAFA